MPFKCVLLFKPRKPTCFDGLSKKLMESKENKSTPKRLESKQCDAKKWHKEEASNDNVFILQPLKKSGCSKDTCALRQQKRISMSKNNSNNKGKSHKHCCTKCKRNNNNNNNKILLKNISNKDSDTKNENGKESYKRTKIGCNLNVTWFFDIPRKDKEKGKKETTNVKDLDKHKAKEDVELESESSSLVEFVCSKNVCESCVERKKEEKQKEMVKKIEEEDVKNETEITSINFDDLVIESVVDTGDKGSESISYSPIMTPHEGNHDDKSDGEDKQKRPSDSNKDNNESVEFLYKKDSSVVKTDKEDHERMVLSAVDAFREGEETDDDIYDFTCFEDDDDYEEEEEEDYDDDFYDDEEIESDDDDDDDDDDDEEELEQKQKQESDDEIPKKPKKQNSDNKEDKNIWEEKPKPLYHVITDSHRRKRTNKNIILCYSLFTDNMNISKTNQPKKDLSSTDLLSTTRKYYKRRIPKKYHELLKNKLIKNDKKKQQYKTIHRSNILRSQRDISKNNEYKMQYNQKINLTENNIQSSLPGLSLQNNESKNKDVNIKTEEVNMNPLNHDYNDIKLMQSSPILTSTSNNNNNNNCNINNTCDEVKSIDTVNKKDESVNKLLSSNNEEDIEANNDSYTIERCKDDPSVLLINAPRSSRPEQCCNNSNNTNSCIKIYLNDGYSETFESHGKLIKTPRDSVCRNNSHFKNKDLLKTAYERNEKMQKKFLDLVHKFFSDLQVVKFLISLFAPNCTLNDEYLSDDQKKFGKIISIDNKSNCDSGIFSKNSDKRNFSNENSKSSENSEISSGASKFDGISSDTSSCDSKSGDIFRHISSSKMKSGAISKKNFKYSVISSDNSKPGMFSGKGFINVISSQKPFLKSNTNKKTTTANKIYYRFESERARNTSWLYFFLVTFKYACLRFLHFLFNILLITFLFRKKK